MKVTIEHLRAMQAVRARINNVPLHKIEFYENGKKIEIDEEIICVFELIGLSNIDFITSGAYLEPVRFPCGCRISEAREIEGKMQCSCGKRR